MNNELFTKKIQATIERCAYDFLIARPNSKVQCTCVEPSTNQGNPECPICLGTGCKLSIKRMHGASENDMKTSNSGGGKSSYVYKRYFMPHPYKLKIGDLILDDDEVYYVYRPENKKGLKADKTHQEVMTLKKLNDHTIILKNFKKIVDKYI